MAIPATGRGSYIRFEEESTFGTAEATLNNTRPVVSMSLQTVRRTAPVPDLHAGGVLPRRSFVVSDESGGSVRLVATYDNVGLLLKSWLGSVSTTGAGAPYTHEYTLAAALPSLTVEAIRGNATNSETFEGVQVASGSLSVEVGQPMFLELDFLAETSATRGAAGTPSVSATENPILHSHAGQLSFDGNSYDLISLRLSLANALDRRPKLGSTQSQQFARTGYGSVLLECTIEAVSNQNDTLLAANRATTQGDVSIAFTSGTRSVTVTGQNAIIEEATDPVGDAGIISQRLRFRCESDGTDLGLKIAVINNESSGTSN